MAVEPATANAIGEVPMSRLWQYKPKIGTNLRVKTQLLLVLMTLATKHTFLTEMSEIESSLQGRGLAHYPRRLLLIQIYPSGCFLLVSFVIATPMKDGHVRHFFSEAYARKLLAQDFHVDTLQSGQETCTVRSLVKVVATKN